MRSILPPREKSKHNSDDNNGAGRGDTNHHGSAGNVDYLELCVRQYPAARRVAVLSLLPGLGQIRNGELGKGLFFLAITAANAVMVLSVILNKPVTDALTAAAGALHRQPNFELAVPLQHGLIESPALFIYMALVATFVWYAIRDAYDGAVRVIRSGHRPPRYALTLPEAASGSYLAHFAVMAAFTLLVIFFITPQQPKEQVTVIELVQPEKPKPPAPPEPKHDRPKPKAETPKPIVQPKPIVEPKPVVKPQVVKHVEPPRPMPVAVATPTNEPAPLSTAPVAAPAADPTPAPAASGGGSSSGTGTGGGGGGDGADIDMGPYMRELQRKIKKSWYPPKGNESKRIKVSFKVHKDGSITKLKLVTSSGVSIADDAATQAVNDAAPFAPLPDGVGDEVDINFTFDYNVFGRH